MESGGRVDGGIISKTIREISPPNQVMQQKEWGGENDDGQSNSRVRSDNCQPQDGNSNIEQQQTDRKSSQTGHFWRSAHARILPRREDGGKGFLTAWQNEYQLHGQAIVYA